MLVKMGKRYIKVKDLSRRFLIYPILIRRRKNPICRANKPSNGDQISKFISFPEQ